MRTLSFETDSPEMTQEIGRRLGERLRAGDVLALIGPLGCGKTTLTKGIGEGAGLPTARAVNSPTFVIVNEYDAARAGDALRIYHIDAYRLRGPGDLDALGFDEMYGLGAVVIEWADRIAGLLPVDHLSLKIESTGSTSRRFTCHAGGPCSERLLEALPGC